MCKQASFSICKHSDRCLMLIFANMAIHDAGFLNYDYHPVSHMHMSDNLHSISYLWAEMIKYMVLVIAWSTVLVIYRHLSRQDHRLKFWYTAMMLVYCTINCRFELHWDIIYALLIEISWRKEWYNGWPWNICRLNAQLVLPSNYTNFWSLWVCCERHLLNLINTDSDIVSIHKSDRSRKGQQSRTWPKMYIYVQSLGILRNYSK